MKRLVEIIAKALVNTPEQVNITEISDNGATVFELRVAAEDMGKQGRIAKAIRPVVKASAIRENKKRLFDVLNG